MPDPTPSLPADARRSLRIYNLLFPFALIVMLPGIARRTIKRGNFRANFGQRFGRYSPRDRERFASGNWTWIHSISVGETLIALKLARQLRATDPTAQIVISVTTSTGFALATEAATDWLIAIYNPVDFLPVVRAAFAAIRPTRVLLVEGEIWPNLVAECRQRAIPVAVVNARLSPRSESRFRKYRQWTGPIFRLLDAICVTDPEDIARWESLGFPREKLHHTGSIKFDHAAPRASRADEFRALAGTAGIGETTPVLLGGSTFPGEEKLLAEAFIELRRTVPELVLILAPRHVERLPEVLGELAPLGLRITRRSALPLNGSSPCDVLLIDTTGELRDWYNLATVVFVGKSLTATGGQNPVEPAVLGKPVVFGPHMENFATIVAHLLASGAALQVADPAALTTELRTLLADPARREHVGQRAKAALELHQGATARTLAAFSAVQ